jgi:hypothetical protein
MFSALIDAELLFNRGLGLMCAGAGLEVFNLALVRTVFWRRSLAHAPRSGSAPAVFPIATFISTPGRREIVPAVGFGASF